MALYQNGTLINGVALPADISAEQINFDDTTSQLGATDVQGAIDALNDNFAWKLLGTIGTSDTLQADISEYRELLIVYLVNSGSPYMSSVYPTSAISNVIYYSVYQNSTYSAYGEIAYSDNTFSLTSTVTGWRSMAVAIYAR